MNSKGTGLDLSHQFFLLDVFFVFGGSRRGENFMFRTMLVEDNPSFRRVLRFYLQSEFPSICIVEAVNGGGRR